MKMDGMMGDGDVRLLADAIKKMDGMIGDFRYFHGLLCVSCEGMGIFVGQLLVLTSSLRQFSLLIQHCWL